MTFFDNFFLLLLEIELYCNDMIKTHFRQKNEDLIIVSRRYFRRSLNGLTVELKHNKVKYAKKFEHLVRH